MLEVDLKKLRGVISDYKNILDQLENNNTDIIYQFNELTKYWQDQKMISLTSSFNLEKRRVLNLERNVKQQLNIYRYLENEYEKIGRKVKCNLDSKDLLNDKLDSIINKINSIINRYDNLGDISFYSRAYLIREQKKEMKSVLNSFKTIKKDINNKFSKIEDIENQVAAALENIKVETFAVNHYEGEE